MEKPWDVIVVGARCAGASLATHLARRGRRVLMLDAAPRGTNMPMSTHYVHPPGMEALDRLGIGDRIRAVTPPTVRFRYALDSAEVIASLDEQRPAYAARRSVVDPLLQEAAVEAGATFLDCHKVTGLLRRGERVTGVVAQGERGSVEFHADLVVGADGVRSKIAELTGAEQYLTDDNTRDGYFAYFDAPAEWTEPFDAALEHIGEELRYVFRCDGGKICVAYTAPRAQVAAWSKDTRQHFQRALLGSPTTRRLTEGREPGKLIGAPVKRFFYRRPVGPGFALVGDAGHFKDFVTGHGMTDAFLDAERMTKAILDGRPEAFTAYWHARDAETLPLHLDAIQQGRVGYNSPFLRAVIARFGKDPDLAKRLTLLFERRITPQELVPPGILLQTAMSALLRGRLSELTDFARIGALQARASKLISDSRRKAKLSEPPSTLPPVPAVASPATGNSSLRL